MANHRTTWAEITMFPWLFFRNSSPATSISISIYICMYMYIRRHLYGLSEHMVHMHMLRYSYWFIMPFKASPVSIPIGRLYTSYSWLCIYIYTSYCSTMLIMLYPHSYWTFTRFRHTQTSYTSCTNVPHCKPM